MLESNQRASFCVTPCPPFENHHVMPSVEYRINDEKLRKDLVKAYGMGMTVKDTCGYARLSPDTFYKWKKKAADGEEPYAKLFEDMMKSRSDKVQTTLNRLNNFAKDDAKMNLEQLKILGKYQRDKEPDIDINVSVNNDRINLAPSDEQWAEIVAKREQLDL